MKERVHLYFYVCASLRVKETLPTLFPERMAQLKTEKWGYEGIFTPGALRMLYQVVYRSIR